MTRDPFVQNTDGFSGFDQIVERSADRGAPRTFNPPDRLRQMWPPAFRARVDDAVRRLSEGEPQNEIRERHGIIVVRTAVAELMPKAKVIG